jgi:hypothetical protein
MADLKISQLSSSTTPLAGTEVLPIVQSGATKQVSVDNLTAGRAISATQITLTAGNVIVSDGQGIDFSATLGTGTSELLDDYEEGTWTPTLVMTGTNFASITYDSSTLGIYTKVGNLVTFTAWLMTDAVDTTGATGFLCVGGLPFNAKIQDYLDPAITVGAANEWTTNNPLSATIQNGTTRMFLRSRSTANGATSAMDASMVTNGSDKNQIILSGSYYTA